MISLYYTQLWHQHYSYIVYLHRRKIRLIEGNAKCRHLKKLTCKVTLRQLFICLRLRTPYPPLTHCIGKQFTLNGGEGEELNQREGWRSNSSQSWVENTNMTECISTLKKNYGTHVLKLDIAPKTYPLGQHLFYFCLQQHVLPSQSMR